MKVAALLVLAGVLLTVADHPPNESDANPSQAALIAARDACKAEQAKPVNRNPIRPGRPGVACAHAAGLFAQAVRTTQDPQRRAWFKTCRRAQAAQAWALSARDHAFGQSITEGFEAWARRQEADADLAACDLFLRPNAPQHPPTRPKALPSLIERDKTRRAFA